VYATFHLGGRLHVDRHLGKTISETPLLCSSNLLLSTVALRFLLDNKTTYMVYPFAYRAYPSSNIASSSELTQSHQADPLACRRGLHGFATAVNILRMWHDMEEHKDSQDAASSSSMHAPRLQSVTLDEITCLAFGNHHGRLPGRHW
jgi:hypothetical protein